MSVVEKFIEVNIPVFIRVVHLVTCLSFRWQSSENKIYRLCKYVYCFNLRVA